MEEISISWDYFVKPLFSIGGEPVSLLSLVVCLCIVFASFATARWGERIIDRTLLKAHIEGGLRNSLSRLARYGIIGIGVLMALDALGISLNSLTAISAVLMVGVGFGLQNVTQNFISGLIILLERPIKQGDLVHVHGVEGKVIAIGLRSTLIETRDEVSVIVPNGQFISEQVVNESHSSGKMRLHINVGAAYGSDPRKVEKVLMEIAGGHPRILSKPKPRVQFKNFGDSSLDFALLVWIDNIWDGDFTASDLRFAIEERFRLEDIAIPFPQRDIHIKSGGNLGQT